MTSPINNKGGGWIDVRIAQSATKTKKKHGRGPAQRANRPPVRRGGKGEGGGGGEREKKKG